MTKIKSLQGLRAIAFLAIFISHTELGPFSALGAWGVSVFFILSGFLMGYNYIQREENVKFGFNFAWKKIKKLYPLHIIAMLFCVILVARNIILYNVGSFPKLILDIILQASLLDIWIPNSTYYEILNGVSWFLCVMFFLYFMFPLILKGLKKCKSKKTAFIWIIGLLLVQCLISFLAYRFGNPENNSIFSIEWITYYCPIARLVDFLIGCFLGWIFLNSKDNSSNRFFTSLFSILLILLILFSWYAYYSKNLLGNINYVKYTLLFTPTTILLVWIIAKNNDIISWILSNKIIVWIGNLSPYLFLIHSVVIKYSNKIFSLFNLELSIKKILVAIFSFILSIISAFLWEKIYNYFINLKEKRKTIKESKN